MTEENNSARDGVWQYLILNKHLLNLSQIAKDAGIPESTLRSIANEKRSLSQKNADLLLPVIERLGGEICL